MRIRDFRIGDEPVLWDVFFSAIHELAARDYSAEQVHAWAPADMDRAAWAARIRALQPWVAEHEGRVAGYADLQPDGCIDHFFVSACHARQGVGRALMEHLLRQARGRGLAELAADVSRTAQPFFERFGFEVVEYRLPVRRGVAIPNARMRRVLPPGG
ncbi:GNAT family N-acetyltransferase [Stenotrophomonas sp. MMGLT7]|uniref:GNAT family N-acetyltransferase n=1 Tax=Stenotrophomonas sp. MMGLT7 TaxID=2901227 RepID=UPI001E34D769|nr:GNAT family N-acetyltransferase [Stenotrophomonas sp. MMGLT7]